MTYARAQVTTRTLRLVAKGQASFVELVTGTYDKLLGGSMSESTADDVGQRHRLARHRPGHRLRWPGHRGHCSEGDRLLTRRDRPVRMAAIWGFLTALSRFTAVLDGARG